MHVNFIIIIIIIIIINVVSARTLTVCAHIHKHVKLLSEGYRNYKCLTLYIYMLLCTCMWLLANPLYNECVNGNMHVCILDVGMFTIYLRSDTKVIYKCILLCSRK